MAERLRRVIVRLLVDAGADMDKANNDGWTPLQVASRSHHDDIVEMLERAGATGYSPFD